MTWSVVVPTLGLRAGLVLITLLAAACSAAVPAAPSATSVPPVATAAPAPAATAAPAPAATAAPAAAPASSTSKPLSPSVHVRVGDQMFAPLAPVYIALDHGYFQAEGLDIELVSTPDPTQVVTELSLGQFDFGVIGPDPALFNAMARGINVRLLASSVNNGPTDRVATFILRSDLLDTGRYKTPSDLKGMTFGIPGPQGRFYINRFLIQAGLTDEDVTYVQMALPDMVAALTSKGIDGAWEVEPLVTLADKQGVARTVATTGELLPGAIAQALAMNPTFGASQPEAATRFVVAYLEGLREYYQAFNRGATDRAPVTQVLANHTQVKDVNLYSVIGMQSVDPNATMDANNWTVYQDYFVKIGAGQQKVDLNQFIDQSYLNAALERLGRGS